MDLISRTRRALNRVGAWVWVSLVLLALLAEMMLVSRPQPIRGAVQVDTATVVRTGVPGAVPKTVKLPHVWDDEVPPWSGDARYEIEWPESLCRRPANAAPLSIYIPRVGARFRVTLNGERIEESYWDAPGYADTSVVPQLIDIPCSAVRDAAADNHLVIEVRGQLLRKSGLAPLSIGPRDAMENRYQRVYWWQVHVTWMLVACSLLVALLSGLIWFQGAERVFAYLAAGSLAWAVRLGLSPLVHPPLSFELWFLLHKLSYSWYAGFIYLFLWDLFDHRARSLRMLGNGVIVVAPLWLTYTVLSGEYGLYRIWSAVLGVVALTALALMFRRARWGLDNNQRLLLVAGVVTVICGLRDFLVVQLGWSGDADLRWMPIGSLVFTLTLAAVVVERTSRYIQQIGQLNRALELRVNEKESELNAAFQRLRDAERRQVLEDERRRLTRDMHDGLGSQLVQTLNVVRSNASLDTAMVGRMLTHALDELRMTLDSMEPLEGDLPAILGTLRRRIAPALEAGGIELDWQVEEVPPLEGLESRGVMHLFRALQEVFANIIKHAHARRVVVRTWVEGGRVMLSVCDDGVGLGEGFREGGRGVNNVRLRAVAIGATVEFIDTHPGTCVRFRFGSSGL